MEVETKNGKIMIIDILVPEIKELVINFCVFAVEHTDVTMSLNARNCVKDNTFTTQCFLFVLFSFVLLQQVFCKIPANQIIISTHN